MHDTRKRNDSDSPLRTTKPVTPTFTIYPRYTVLPGAKYKSVPRARQKETNHGEALIGACPVTTDCIVAMSYCENNNMVYSFPNLEKACIMTWRIGRGSNEGAQRSSYNLIP